MENQDESQIEQEEVERGRDEEEEIVHSSVSTDEATNNSKDILKKKNRLQSKYVKSITSNNNNSENNFQIFKYQNDDKNNTKSEGGRQIKKSIYKRDVNKMKQTKWIISLISDGINPKELIYVNGEVLVNISQRNGDFTWESAWNQVKKQGMVEADFVNDVVSIHFEKPTVAFSNFKEQAKRYAMHPDLKLHEFGVVLLQYEKIYEQFQIFTKASINKILSNESLISEFQSRKQLFKKLARNYYKQMNDREQYFLSIESRPDLNIQLYLAQEAVYGRALANLLGTSQISLQSIFLRKGLIEFYPFETQLSINRRVVQGIVQHFNWNTQQVQYDQFNNFKDLNSKNNQTNYNNYHEIKVSAIDVNEELKFITFDEIEFQAKVRIEYITLDTLLNSPPNECKHDFYATIIIIEPSSNIVLQIDEIRKNKKNKFSQQIKELESDIAYTVQSEYFIQLNHSSSSSQLNSDISQKNCISFKKCGTKEIKAISNC